MEKKKKNNNDNGSKSFLLSKNDKKIKKKKASSSDVSSAELNLNKKGYPLEKYLQKVFLLVKSKTKHDFSNYKRNTVLRRIERHMTVLNISELKDYVQFLHENPLEIEALFKEILIRVTNFFRDAEGFESLAKNIIPKLVEKANEDSFLRIWVPGCATGEEAYSIAILFMEEMERQNIYKNIQIFATDIDIESVNYARIAQYPESIVSAVSPERLKRFFIREDRNYKVKKQIREMVIFAIQNFIKDPPFSRLDLISCRNILIYMNQELQKKVIPLFHYTLNQNGYLFLGSAEGVGRYSDLFKSVDTKWKVFQRKGGKKEALPVYPPINIQEKDLNCLLAPKKQNSHEGLNIKELVEKIILSEYSQPSVLINEKFDILYFHGSVERFLVPATGVPSFNILTMSRKELHYPIRTAIYKAIEIKTPISCEGVQIKQDDNSYLIVDVVIKPLINETKTHNLMMVVFQEKPLIKKHVSKKKIVVEANNIDQRILVLEKELQLIRENLQATIEESEAYNEELKSANEELQSTNEELQSSNEELETSREELQSTNEELLTVNTELRNKIDELSGIKDDINNFLTSIEMGFVFLDNNLKIRRFSPATVEIFPLIPLDVGRSINDFSSKVLTTNFYEHARDVLNTLQHKEVEEQTSSGRRISIRFKPYRTLENVINGVIITFVDITDSQNFEKKNVSA